MVKVLFILLNVWVVGNLALQKRDSSQLSYELYGLQQLADLADTSTFVHSISSSKMVYAFNLPLTSSASAANAITTTSGFMVPITTTTASNTATTINNGYPDNSEAFSNLPTSSSFGNTIYAGAATFDTPKASSSVSPLYPIQSNMNVTFKWQYTALRVRPVNVTLNAVGPNSVTYPITILDGATSEAIWNFASVPTSSPPLMNGYYKIQLYDQRGLKADYSPGWMVPCTTLSIALYTPDLYDTYSTESNYCPTCFYNSANSLFYEAYQPLAITFSVALITSIIFILKVLH